MKEFSEISYKLLLSIGAFALVAVMCVFLLPLHSPLTPWVLMWVLAGAQWLVFKFMRFVSAGASMRVRPLFFLWIGMETRPFLRNRNPRSYDYASIPALPTAFASMLAGILLLLFCIPQIGNPIVTGALGMLAVLCLMHFGTFHLLARGFDRMGIQVTPIMIEPWKAKDLSDFWGRRWNRAFSDWAGEFVFRPLARHFGTAKGILAGFLVSGLAHEFTISIPAGGGFGLPTLYFLIQGVVMILLRKIKLPAAATRLVTFLCVLLPAPILFHPPFLERVIHPMIQTLLCI